MAPRAASFRLPPGYPVRASINPDLTQTLGRLTLEPDGTELIDPDVVGFVKGHRPMTLKQTEHEYLRSLLKPPQLPTAEYSADPLVQGRVGRVLSETLTRIHVKQGAARDDTWHSRA